MSSLTVSIIQSFLQWEDKQANLNHFEEQILAIKEKTELVVLPEMFSTGFSMNPEKLAEKMDGPTVAWMKRIAASKRIILTGSVIIEENGLYHNRLLWVLPNGQLGVYDKRHSFAFARENEKYTAGNKRLIASVNGWKINLLVCYDLRFPVWCRQQTRPKAEEPTAAEPEYDLMIVVANWPERRNYAWKTLLKARAIENQCYVIGLNRIGEDGSGIYHSGDSMIVDPLGQPLYENAHTESVFTHSLDKEKLNEIRSAFPFWKDADHFSIDS